MLAMFDSEVPNAEKAAMAQALLQHPVPDIFAPGKPGGRHFEQITPKLADVIAGRAQAPCLSSCLKGGSRGHLRNGHKTLITLSCLKLQGICL